MIDQQPGIARRHLKTESAAMNMNIRANAISQVTEEREFFGPGRWDQIAPGYVKFVTNSRDDRLVIDDGGGIVSLTLDEARQVRDFLNRTLSGCNSNECC